MASTPIRLLDTVLIYPADGGQPTVVRVNRSLRHPREASTVPLLRRFYLGGGNREFTLFRALRDIRSHVEACTHRTDWGYATSTTWPGQPAVEGPLAEVLSSHSHARPT